MRDVIYKRPQTDNYLIFPYIFDVSLSLVLPASIEQFERQFSTAKMLRIKGLFSIFKECNYEKQKELESSYNNNNRHWLLKISDIHYRPPKSEIETQMVCQKLVGTDGN